MKKESSPWYPPRCDKADIAAVKACASGTANPEQQVRAIKWIVEDCCGYYDLSYRPGEAGRRDTDFAEGKRFVGAEIVKMTKLDLAKLKSNPQEEA